MKVRVQVMIDEDDFVKIKTDEFSSVQKFIETAVRAKLDAKKS